MNRFEAFFSSLITRALGLGVAAVGAVGLWLEVKPPSVAHTSHIAIFAGIFLFGVFIALPPATTVFKNLVVIVGPYVPRVGRWSRSTVVIPDDKPPNDTPPPSER